MNSLNVRVTGTSPLMMHKDTLSNPLHPATKAHKEVTSKRKKTDDDYIFLAKNEFIHSLHFDDKLGPIIPANVMEAAIFNDCVCAASAAQTAPIS